MKAFPLFKILAFLFTGLAAVAASLPPLDPQGRTAPIRVACVGDSITAGSGAARGESYPDQLQEMLGEAWEVGNFGVSGRTMLRKGDNPYWRENAFRQAQDFRPDVVIIMLGTNDSKPHNWVHRAEYPTDYADMVKTFLALPSKPRVYVCRPCPVPAPGNFGINEAGVQEAIGFIDRLAEELNLGVIDMHAALEKKPELLPDRVHPNTAGATVMAKTAARALTGTEPPTPATLTRPNSLFRRGAVLQREVELPVWGTAPAGTIVTVAFAGQQVTTTTGQDGRWRVRLKPLTASAESRTMTITGGNTVAVDDILVGDVWLASGQSNMERQLGPRPPQKEILGWREEVASANYPLIRQFYVPQKISTQPVPDAKGRWTVCSPRTAHDFTAVGYFFARDLHRVQRVPIGIIHSSWGGTPAESWTSAEALKALPDFRPTIELMELAAGSGGQKAQATRVNDWFARHDSGSAADGGWQAPELPAAASWKAMETPARFETVGLTAFDGVVWFRKEFTLPAAAAGKAAVLHLGQIDDQDTTWVNGQLVGTTSVYNAQRDYRVPADTLRAGRNVIAVRVVDFSGPGGWLGQPSNFKLEFPSEAGLAPIALGDRWQFQATADFATAPAFPRPPGNGPYAPTVLYNAMIAPLIPFPIKGVVWYQGEANNSRAKQYQMLFPAMIADWRKRWGLGDFPFLFVQIAPFKDMTPEIREAQFLTLVATPNTAMAVTLDVGDAGDIHPANKAPVGARLALAARALSYGERIEYSGPTYRAMKIAGHEVWLAFDHVGDGLVAKDGPLMGFTIAGADHTFVAAQAEIRGDQVVVWSDAVKQPVAARYGWANVPDVNLYNRAGLPASSFRTDVEP